MSDSKLLSRQLSDLNYDAREIRIIRFTLGVGIATFLAAWIDWPLAFVAPIFTAKFLFEKKTMNTGIVYELLLAMVVTVAIGITLSLGFSQYPIPILVGVGALMIAGYFLFLDPKWNLFATILLMAILMLPFMAIENPPVAIFLALGLSLSGAVSVGIFAVMHIYLPEREDNNVVTPGVSMTDHFRWFSALRAAVIAFPVVSVFFVFQISEALLSMIFIALLSLMITGEKSIKLSAFLLISNAIGGVIALIAFSVMSLVPNILFYTLFITLLAVLTGSKMINEPTKAPIYSTAFNTALVLIGTTMMSSGVIDEKMWIRLTLLAVVAVYMVIAAFFVETRQWQWLKFKGEMMKAAN
ncbi:hypothetical protein BCU70_11960 [Vibrio sp. 10N.286.49.C2]|uniref:DUF2955 domain-containing protein n=1 Tax=unclassified Vibrio TaxID=2614977 RepID=UPI000C820C51|nr:MULTISPECIES: DUF2955 domain-containing protein [unclassified Vibrio]PMH40056.1 hypothetical protein BCU70_11960 [Vibrio sp. 10N.286.49.C2]PMH52169.1 hypothetical protein BCU66_16295 [Vibrio sp. 10N.286.49.B1]PMH81165.1 hypothetical protein BCU58_21810 [Vibrio sp. 10N.286.48.B7]